MIQAYLSFATAVRATASSVQEGMSGVAIQIPAKGSKQRPWHRRRNSKFTLPLTHAALTPTSREQGEQEGESRATLTLSSPWPLVLQFRMK
jgi:hypothetical protein